MRFAALLTGFLAAAQAEKNYFFRYSGGNDIIDHQRLRSNISIQHTSPGVTLPPYNPKDHFMRLYPNATAHPPAVALVIVPTNPHPPPVPGYYGLSDREGVPDAYRLVYSYRLDEEGPGFKYAGWRLRPAGPGSEPGTLRLRYPIGEGRAAAGEEEEEEEEEEGKGGHGKWRWIAVKEKDGDGDYDKWVPWYVKRCAANGAVLATWDYVNVDLELVEAKGAVNSSAPGGVNE
ncbi:hypothetical protein MYCTH_2311687 [Thermothelomyces thermophilus ATCC 42464]|uniref:Uncharacterized protein n=1 Tax=Thermothelomyces thermophilus (strain ATCC 42464 / BCRC 31852 / DSM 1799) TaxID=573729 RepID=G2QPH7_THET4|nr:uncharacterized protein MYCTH_2311687 [Thermothelomyces thermophilus ATCC 42464]AEO61490.1 hypothetical protein MYCTH_2311687 [Thermothelomyces thermophilus ATCC 42464]